MAYKVLVVDDQKLSRQLFSLMIENSPDYELLYELESASVAYIDCAKYTVDLVIMDIVMADGSTSLDEAKRIKTSFPDIKILAVTSMPEVSYLKKARAAGIDSFWYKEADDITLLEIMDLTMQGESIYPDHTPELTIGNAKSYDFTPSEIRVLREMTTGASNNEIAEKLSGQTAETLGYKNLAVKFSDDVSFEITPEDAGMTKELRHPEARLTLPEGWDYCQGAREQAEIQIKYEGYLQKEMAQIRQARAMEEAAIPADTDYLSIDALRLEAREKLQARQPLSLGQASRIPGVNPADIAVLMVWLKRQKS